VLAIDLLYGCRIALSAAATRGGAGGGGRKKKRKEGRSGGLRRVKLN